MCPLSPSRGWMRLLASRLILTQNDFAVSMNSTLHNLR
ncbi:hypothetical protein LAUMK7_05380 [Mycobacterium kansasii]|uniref:Uncharacterized protein n=1 Tax=Mycobacterium kansasii TaxID=1768 RepID=A0A653F7S0_MYCKA|nr:hypothetical protein MKANGN_20920 [Mycobacterium kansasii]VAZ62921.1 hypothetical protein LAUMK22_04750 [Mycobacterium kansasii]VAZ69342.1 hypothetical protein LAUMK40_05503 [Mycobacterium kansasii]VAZ80484.1 hypothetical protein LAUMK7_05380 [Mycobacterium kansasii]VTP05032.1 hypothetical protein BIN_B_04873 [Mycobacterium kansasii]